MVLLSGMSSFFGLIIQQALIKQVMHDVQLVYNEHDIIAEFNADFNFWFSNDGVPIESGQTDFEFV